MSAADKGVKVEEVQDDEAPELLGNDEANAIDEDALARLGGAAGAKSSKRYAKAMAKLGLKPEPNIFRVSIRKGRAQNLSINKPEVYRFPNTNTFVIFGEIAGDDMPMGAQEEATKAAASAVTSSGAKKADAKAVATTSAADDDEEVDAGDLGEKEIKLVMSQANVSRGKAIKALKNNKGDIVNTIMELTM
jgi:nascent polypeptide-associated complex subunit alpha